METEKGKRRRKWCAAFLADLVRSESGVLLSALLATFFQEKSLNLKLGWCSDSFMSVS